MLIVQVISQDITNHTQGIYSCMVNYNIELHAKRDYRQPYTKYFIHQQNNLSIYKIFHTLYKILNTCMK